VAIPECLWRWSGNDIAELSLGKPFSTGRAALRRRRHKNVLALPASTVTSARDLGVSVAFLISRVGRRSPQLKRRGELDRFVQRPVQRAAHGVKAVRPLDCLPRRFRRFQSHGHVNAANDEYAILSFHLPGYIRGQFSVAGIDLARFQRASKSAHHSTGGRRNHIVNG